MRVLCAGGPIYDCNPRPEFKTVKDGPATAVLDADGALGIHVGPHAMRLAIAKAKVVGSGTVVVRNAGHFGACPPPPPRSAHTQHTRARTNTRTLAHILTF